MRKKGPKEEVSNEKQKIKLKFFRIFKRNKALLRKASLNLIKRELGLVVLEEHRDQPSKRVREMNQPPII